jgi:hypothetical protein
MKMHLKRKDFPQRHSGTGLFATVPAGEASKEGQVTGPLRSVRAASRQEVSLTEAGVATAFSPDRSGK